MYNGYMVQAMIASRTDKAGSPPIVKNLNGSRNCPRGLIVNLLMEVTMYTVSFAQNRSECGAEASFKFRYEADRFVAVLRAAGYWVTTHY